VHVYVYSVLIKTDSLQDTHVLLPTNEERSPVPKTSQAEVKNKPGRGTKQKVPEQSEKCTPTKDGSKLVLVAEKIVRVLWGKGKNKKHYCAHIVTVGSTLSTVCFSSDGNKHATVPNECIFGL
jgi:hypothetical protein